MDDPAVVVRQFLQAAFVERNTAKAQVFMCNGRQAIDLIGKFRADDPGLEVSWGTIPVNISGDSASAEVDITFTSPQQIGPEAYPADRESWLFVLRHETAWRVCDATNITPAPTSSLSPK
jgi:hypothetical protein